MQRIPYPELNAAERIGREEFSQATKVKAILLTGGRVAVEVWHGREAATYTPTPEQLQVAMKP